MVTSLFLLAQDAAGPAAPAAQPWWHVLVQSAFGLTLLFIFLTAIITVIVQQRKKDKCLKLMNDYHVTYVDQSGKPVWGDLVVYSKGLELLFDTAYRSRRGIEKTSVLIYPPQIETCHAIIRPVSGLTAKERVQRERQIRRSFSPGLIRRSWRALRNILNTLRDAFSKALTALVGQLTKIGPGKAIASQQGGVNEIGQTLLGAAANAYEPMLERHIGKPVVLQLNSPADPDKRLLELPGFLVDYTDKHVAVFNVSQEPVESRKLTVTETTEGNGFKIERTTDQRLRIQATGLDVLLVKRVKTAKRMLELDVALPNGASIEVSTDGTGPVDVELERTLRVDVVCPRAQGVIYFGGELTAGYDKRDIKSREHGVAPEQVAEQIDEEMGEPAPEAESRQER